MPNFPGSPSAFASSRQHPASTHNNGIPVPRTGRVQCLNVLLHVYVLSSHFTSVAAFLCKSISIHSQGQRCEFLLQSLNLKRQGPRELLTRHPGDDAAYIACTVIALELAHERAPNCSAVISIVSRSDCTNCLEGSAAANTSERTAFAAAYRKRSHFSCFLPPSAGTVQSCFVACTFGNVFSSLAAGTNSKIFTHKRSWLPSITTRRWCSDIFVARRICVTFSRERTCATSVFTATATWAVPAVAAPAAAPCAAPSAAGIGPTQSFFPLQGRGWTTQDVQDVRLSRRKTRCFHVVQQQRQENCRHRQEHPPQDQAQKQQLLQQRQHLPRQRHYSTQQEEERKAMHAAGSAGRQLWPTWCGTYSDRPTAHHCFISYRRKTPFQERGCSRTLADAALAAHSCSTCRVWESAAPLKGPCGDSRETGLKAAAREEQVRAASAAALVRERGTETGTEGAAGSSAGGTRRARAREATAAEKRREETDSETTEGAADAGELHAEEILEIAAEEQAGAPEAATPPAGPAARHKRELLLQPRLWRDMLRALGTRVDEVEEKLVKGGGKGGQKINKTSSCVVLVHRPTQTVVRCQQSRSQRANRALARVLLLSKLRQQEAKEERQLQHVLHRERQACRQPTEEQKRAVQVEKQRRSEIKAERRARMRSLAAADFE